jgi:predicted nucleotidyltransferase
MTAEPLRLRRLLERLSQAEVSFILVGGLAVNAWGYLRATRDVDLVPDPTPRNLERLDTVLRDLGGRVEVGGRLLEGSAITTFLRTGDRTLVLTELGRVDVLQGLPQIPPYSSLARNATSIDLDGLALEVCSLEDLLEMKGASDRPRDREDIEALEAARDSRPPDAPGST